MVKNKEGKFYLLVQRGGRYKDQASLRGLDCETRGRIEGLNFERGGEAPRLSEPQKCSTNPTDLSTPPFPLVGKRGGIWSSRKGDVTSQDITNIRNAKLGGDETSALKGASPPS